MCARSLGSGEERANAQTTCLKPCFQISLPLNLLSCAALASPPSPKKTPKAPFGTKQVIPLVLRPGRASRHVLWEEINPLLSAEMELCSGGAPQPEPDRA